MSQPVWTKNKKICSHLESFSQKFFIQPAQWLNFLLVALFFKILFLAAKTRLLGLPLLRAITLLPYYMPSLSLLLLLHRLFLLCFAWPNTWRMTFRKFLTPFWILDLLLLFLLLYQLLSNTKALVRGYWRSGSQTYIRVKLTWSIITSSSNVRTILPLPGPRVKIMCHLPPLFSRLLPCFAGSNTSERWKIRPAFSSLGKNLSPFFSKTWVSSRLLSIPFGVLFV